MNISNEQLIKLMELAGKNDIQEIESITSLDVSKALVEIERKLNFFDTNINFNPETNSRNVLIVDDLELSIYQLNQLLKKIGITPSVARNKDEAMAEMMKKSFDYVLIDLFLPDSNDGLELIQEAVNLRDSHKQNFRILIMSGTDDKVLVDKCYKLGIDGYIAKTEMWHTDILKYINTTAHRDNQDFSKYTINNDVTSYIIKRFNTKSTFNELLVDVNSSILAGQPNVILNLELVNVFDADNAYIFAEIYKACAGSKGTFALVTPSEKIKEALSFAYLDGIIPVFPSVESALDYINKKTNA